MRIARVFPTKTSLSPNDVMAFFGPPPFYAEADEVHISVLFTWDKPHAEWLAEQWKHVAPVKIGGPAYGLPSGEFVPGQYVKHGGVITSRGCPNNCWFCSVWRREPNLIELPVQRGINVLDDNLLACSYEHIEKVFRMLSNEKQLGHRIEFTGGLEAKRLEPWHVEHLSKIKPKQMFFAYDTPDDWEPLRNAAAMLKSAGIAKKSMRCYVLIGYPRDTIEKAVSRLEKCLLIGFTPMAMLWRDEKNTSKKDPEWAKLQRLWSRPALIYRMAKGRQCLV